MTQTTQEQAGQKTGRAIRTSSAQQMELASMGPCGVSLCTGVVMDPDQVLCGRCWSKLPPGVQRHLPAELRRRPNAAKTQEMLGHALARLSAELQGALVEDEFNEADLLTRQCTAFESFTKLINAGGGYWPKLRCSFADSPSRGERLAHCRLADYYDRAQAARKDPRRACRGVGCGL
jgi:hypothetical protein